MPDSSPSAPYALSERFQNIVAVARSALGDRLQADALADSLGVPNLGVVRPRDIRDFPVLLFLREHGGGAGQLVAKAVGLQKTRAALHIVDATAGLGQDAFVLASLGCTVTLFERNPVIHALLADGLARAALNVDCAAIVERMRLLEGSSIEWLARPGTEAADVVYLDPMFPHRDKSALVKKEMQVFRTIVGDDEDSAQLLAAALERARYRVVVKRPRKASAIEGAEPTTRIEGKSSRYDVYAIRALPPQ